MMELSSSLYYGRRRFDLQNPSRMDRNVEMFVSVEKTLVQVLSTTLLYTQHCYTLKGMDGARHMQSEQFIFLSLCVFRVIF